LYEVLINIILNVLQIIVAHDIVVSIFLVRIFDSVIVRSYIGQSCIFRASPNNAYNHTVDVQLVREGYVNPEAISGAADETAEKRGQQQGFCFRKTRTGRYLPYICWRKGKKLTYNTAPVLC